MPPSAVEIVRNLGIWSGPVQPEPLDGGITNVNFVVRDGPRKTVVRVGRDIPVHHILRSNEIAASRAAHAAGISPEVLHHAPGVMVIAFVEGRTLTAEDMRKPEVLERAVRLVAQAHREMPRHLRGPTQAFWVFHVIRDYAARLQAEASPHAGLMPELLAAAERLEAAVGPVEMVFGHNDLLPANFIDDGARLWLIDWDYAGWGSPLFDLGGLAANNGLGAGAQRRMLELYFDRPCDDALQHRFAAMKCAAALRETLWSMVSERHSGLDFDFAAYSAANLGIFRAAYSDLLQG